MQTKPIFLIIALAVVVTKHILLGISFFETFIQKRQYPDLTMNFKHSFNDLHRIAFFEL